MLSSCASQDLLTVNGSLGRSFAPCAPPPKPLCTAMSIPPPLSSFCNNPSQPRNPHLQISCHAFKKPATIEDRPKTDVQISVDFDNESDKAQTIIKLTAPGKPGLLQVVITALKDLGLSVSKATIDYENGILREKFWVQGPMGAKIQDPKDIKNVQRVLTNAINEPSFVPDKAATRPPPKMLAKQDLMPEESIEFRRRTDLLFGLMDQYLKNDVFSIQKSIVDHVEYTVARSRFRFDDFEAYQATAHSARDRLLESWNDTQQFFKDRNPKRVYYFSMEFLMGRSLLNSLSNLGIKDQYAQALKQLGFDLEVLAEQEIDAALGNGGLGRLAACFLDSFATLDLPAWGYGLRYQYGLFRQNIKDGFQLEQPDFWLNFGNPWEVERVHVSYSVKFYGRVDEEMRNGRSVHKWIPGEMVEAVAYDNPIPGYHTSNTINLRLWAAKPSGGFDMEAFNTGDYVNAILNKQKAEAISSILYPDDRSYQGKELRLKQQYFFVSASLQDIVRRYKDSHSNFEEFSNKVALHLNDTHPAIAVAELMRMLIDEEWLEWKEAWNIVTRVFSLTNHTIISESFEKWPVELMESLLPRHLQIIYEINRVFLEEAKKKVGSDFGRLARLSIVEEGSVKTIRMGNLAIVACHSINAVSQMHANYIKSTLLKDFCSIWPHKFQSKTNGVTQRRWLAFGNPALGDVITKWLGTEAWIKDLDIVAGLRQHASNPQLHAEWNQARYQNKMRLAQHIYNISGIRVSVDAMFDAQVKRIHEYKRQFLNLLSIIHRYDCIKNMAADERKRVVPRVCIFGGKAPPGYEFAKKIVKLVHAIGEKVNNDPEVGDLLKVIFIPDYNVSVAELIIPACDLSQHISTPGSEASGTGNMKFAMNGCLILGTLDGSNIEIRDEIGQENMFTFGVVVDDVPRLRTEHRNFQPPREFQRVLGMIRDGIFGFKDYFNALCDAVDGETGDYYLLGRDFLAYLEAQASVDTAFVDKEKWTEMSILSTAGSGKFSSDRAIREYAEQIWRVEPCKRPV
ncbi:hypothetical protein GOP47_0004266 [Adiantum capillus-veneris]|uniref:Alpha-1,4 glucan phosphorylase n=1 Tax=Adiantum capillus-veneris TaxID=13818 RepID=A0A9D4ZMF6_ADICA|nr:hypothetical protein GOP47_0004266 [Adiantum capillus-veneris]